jgi:ActR/RegA family two-component response regulator
MLSGAHEKSCAAQDTAGYREKSGSSGIPDPASHSLDSEQWPAGWLGVSVVNWTDLFRVRRAAPQKASFATVPMPVRLLLITADREFRERFERVATENRWEVKNAESVDEAISLVGSKTMPLVAYDWEPAGEDWLTGLDKLASLPCRPCVFLVSRVLDSNLWQELISHGGYDVLARSAESEEIRRNIAFAWFWANRPHATLDGQKEMPNS